jgi:EPS-associated MarR family transcriptional regulator
MDETPYRLLKYLQEHPETTQRELAGVLGVSLGKLNYCLKALIQKGCVKAGNFSRSTSKIAYAYLLTPEGVEEKARLAIHFLRAKMQEYDRLKREIEVLQQETGITEPPAPIPQAVENGGHG